jgi:N4-gp56 family major capsid protein
MGPPSSKLPVLVFDDLEKSKGEQITYDLIMQLKNAPIEGDSLQEGTEENLVFHSDVMYIDQARSGVNSGGKMTRKRTIHDLRAAALEKESDWWSRFVDELCFIYASGARGINDDFILGTDYTGRANNSLETPDATHQMYGGDATGKADLVAADKFTLNLVDKAKAKASMLGGGANGTISLQPIRLSGSEFYVCLLNPWQEYDLRTSTDTGSWLDIQKAAAATDGATSPIFTGKLGVYNGVVLHSHPKVIRFDDYGAGGDVEAARALFLGVQALSFAYGKSGPAEVHYDWYETTRDNGNLAIISTSSIFGTKKARFNSQDFGVMAIDTAATEPT